MTLSALDSITGIGPKRRQQLFRHFQSLENIRSASLEELQGAGLPKDAALTVYQHFHINKSKNQEDSEE